MTQPSLVTQKVQFAFWEGIQNIEDIDELNLAAALRVLVKELKCFGITEKNILDIADELEGK